MINQNNIGQIIECDQNFFDTNKDHLYYFFNNINDEYMVKFIKNLNHLNLDINQLNETNYQDYYAHVMNSIGEENISFTNIINNYFTRYIVHDHNLGYWVNDQDNNLLFNFFNLYNDEIVSWVAIVYDHNKKEVAIKYMYIKPNMKNTNFLYNFIMECLKRIIKKFSLRFNTRIYATFYSHNKELVNFFANQMHMRVGPKLPNGKITYEITLMFFTELTGHL